MTSLYILSSVDGENNESGDLHKLRHNRDNYTTPNNLSKNKNTQHSFERRKKNMKTNIRIIFFRGTNEGGRGAYREEGGGQWSLFLKKLFLKFRCQFFLY